MDAITETRPRPRTLGLAWIPPEKVLAIAPKVMDLVERACEYSGGRFDPVSTLQACAGADPNRHWQLWIAGYSGGDEPPTMDSIAVTAITVYPTGLKLLEMILVAGENARSWLQFEDFVAAWAKREGCQRLQALGRRGWSRTLPKHWRQSAVIYEREIGVIDGSV